MIGLGLISRREVECHDKDLTRLGAGLSHTQISGARPNHLQWEIPLIRIQIFK